ncbi:hypothetical protein FRB93_005711 [Tulasnella sp. JGI-2019a]|nr:hypothetical protein FRB93_005711 [Tulasnella sp. JGI-2019a]
MYGVHRHTISGIIAHPKRWEKYDIEAVLGPVNSKAKRKVLTPGQGKSLPDIL